ncbi:MAG: alpha-L-fucosidase [Prolixibacteraceae bacterium]|nr:alpha-L-fucosidase [Prolixibacteraceae bacterium]
MKSTKLLFLAVGLAIILISCSSHKKEEVTYQPTWESLKTHPVPEWLQDAKFGIYAHWGVYSVLAFGNEWYGRLMYDTTSAVYKHHIEKYGDPSVFGYKEFVDDFKAEKFNPQEWAKLIKESGAKYAGIATVHHDGFCMWDSEFTPWNSMNKGPKRDLYGDLVKELRKYNDMHIVATFHHMRTFNWYLPYKTEFYKPINNKLRNAYLSKDWDIFDKKYASLYCNQEDGRNLNEFIDEWHNKVKEVIDNYQPDVIWFDGGQFQGKESEKRVLDILSYYYNKENEWNKPVEILNKFPTSRKFNFGPDVGMLTFEEGRDREASVHRPWIDDQKISDNSWGYIEGQTYKSANEIVDGLIDRVARGGGLLLSLCPMADGTINEAQQKVLKEMGQWLKKNGEAIYGTRPWKVHSEGNSDKFMKKVGDHKVWVFRNNCTSQDIRFTQKDNTLYALILDWPKNNSVLIKTLSDKTKVSTKGIDEISLLGSDEDIEWKQTEKGLNITLPDVKKDKIALVLKIKVKGKLLLN